MASAKVVRASVVLVAAFMAAAAALLLRRDVPWQPVDLLWLNDTEYATDFRESRFAEIAPGAPVDEVLASLGAPLSVYDYADPSDPVEHGVVDVADVRQVLTHGTRYGLSYSRPGEKYDSYFMREVILDENGTVERKISLFYGD